MIQLVLSDSLIESLIECESLMWCWVSRQWRSSYGDCWPDCWCLSLSHIHSLSCAIIAATAISNKLFLPRLPLEELMLNHRWRVKYFCKHWSWWKECTIMCYSNHRVSRRKSTACVHGIRWEVFSTTDPVGCTRSRLPFSVELRRGVSSGSQAGAKP